MANDLKTLQSLIEEALRRGETQMSLARAVGASQPQISKIRSGASGSDSRVARALLEHLRLQESDRRQSEIVAAVSALTREAGSDHQSVVTIVRELTKFVRSMKSIRSRVAVHHARGGSGRRS
jgi:predicted transcriptional regulator